MAVYISQFVGLFLLLLYILGFSICLYITATNDICIDVHKFFSLLFTAICGMALFIFRILRGIRTRIVKYVHMFVHLIAIGCLAYGVFWIFIESKVENSTHRLPSLIMMGAIAVQFILAFLLFTYLYENQRWRLYFAPLHDIIGIWIFICFVGCCITGNWRDNYFNFRIQDIIFTFTIIMSTLIVVFIVLCPFFEWDLEGKL